MPNPYAFISLFSFFIVLAVGWAVYLTCSRKPIHTSFFVLCLFNAYVAFPEFMMRQANDPQTALFWLKTQSFWRIVVIVVLHFSLIYIGKDAILRRWWGRIAFYGPVTAISFIYLGCTKIMCRPGKILIITMECWSPRADGIFQQVSRFPLCGSAMVNLPGMWWSPGI